MRAAEIRSKFLNYFKQNGHQIVESSSLVPHNDPTLLFTNAGMNQFKDVFLGKDPRPYTRAATCQKCVRAGGKHNDLENVGFTARHHTFFEMLGNFSFGDYFKKEAIKYAWQFVTKELALDTSRLYVTVFEKDDEAAEIWHQQEGVPKDRIYRFGEKDNFWSMGDTGPCGPCSEIFYDRGQKYSCGKPTCGMGCDCDRYVEFWNLVFMQYNRDASGTLTPLPKPSVDTGAGLERIALIIQEADSNYETDGFLAILDQVGTLLGRPYVGAPKDLVPSFRVVADHSRATAFLIGDGVMPSNEGRGYVLRRIMRRAVRHGRKLGFPGAFLHKTTLFVIDQMKDAYPDLVEKRAFIERAVLAEEEQFLKTLEKGLSLLDDETSKLAPGTKLPGDVAFKLYDTFGFPLDLTRTILDEKKFGLDEAGFEKAMERQRAESRKHWKGSGDASTDAVYLQLAQALKAKNALPKFTGYTELQTHGKCVSILVAGDQGLNSVDQFIAPALAATADSADQKIIEVVFDATCFYGESGGQSGDHGRIKSATFEGEVIDVQRPVPELIVAHVKPLKGSIQVGQTYLQETDRKLRALTARNHTATHLLHWALREVLGKHVKQAGSTVSSELLRFDFSHFQALNEDEIRKVEDLINEKIWSGDLVKKQEMNKDQAVAAGAIAFFGEKYGEVVRVVSVGDYSTELCGGTHVDQSSDIHLFKIASEGGIAAGVRRIIAYTSEGAFEYLRTREVELRKLRDKLKAANVEEVGVKVDRLLENERALRKTIESFEAKASGAEADTFLGAATPLKEGGRLVCGIAQPSDQGMKKLRELADSLKSKAPDAVLVLGMADPTGKANLIVLVGPQAPKSAQANTILQKLAPLIDGKGGGKPDFAQAGGTKAAGLAEAMKAAKGMFA